MALFTDYHEDLKLPAETLAQIAEDTSRCHRSGEAPGPAAVPPRYRVVASGHAATYRPTDRYRRLEPHFRPIGEALNRPVTAGRLRYASPAAGMSSPSSSAGSSASSLVSPSASSLASRAS